MLPKKREVRWTPNYANLCPPLLPTPPKLQILLSQSCQYWGRDTMISLCLSRILPEFCPNVPDFCRHIERDILAFLKFKEDFYMILILPSKSVPLALGSWDEDVLGRSRILRRVQGSSAMTMIMESVKGSALRSSQNCFENEVFYINSHWMWGLIEHVECVLLL